MFRVLVSVAALVLLCSGCASVTQGMTHMLRIDTETAQGQVIDDVDCELTNDQGTTAARSGSATLVRRSSKDLEIRCIKPGLPDASARLTSRANAGMAGNILIGGAIGAMLDHSSGAAYTYPTWIKLVFGEHAVLDRSNEREGTVLAAAPVASVATPTTADRTIAPVTAVPARAEVPAVAVSSRSLGVLARGDTFDYRLTDRATQSSSTAILRVARVDDRQIIFNEGARVERPNGELVTMGPRVLGELDHVTPPGGWMPGGRVPRGAWPLKFATGAGTERKSYDLTAQAGREQPVRTQAGQFNAVRIDIEGWLEQAAGHVSARAPYRATVWVSPELRRPIRFEARSRTTSVGGITGFMIDETAELIAISRD
jgi:hypothetical protein